MKIIKALIVEDNPINMELVMEILTANGISADEAVNGEGAIANVEKDRERFISAGFDDYISKPLDVNSFIEKINKFSHINNSD
jgi:CheY-like chemotaxis protein